MRVFEPLSKSSIVGAKPIARLRATRRFRRFWPRAAWQWQTPPSVEIQRQDRGWTIDRRSHLHQLLAPQKLPLHILAKGATMRWEPTQLGDLGENVSDHSSSG
jgi:hypothetical protein